jgi:hypothetical protein
MLGRIAAGEGDRGDRQQVADHLATCSSCSEEYRVAASLESWARQAAQDLGDTPRTAPLGIRLGQARFGFAAAAIGAVGVAAAVLWALSLRADNTRLSNALREQADSVRTARTEVGALREAQAKELTGLQARLDEALAPALNAPIVDLAPRDAFRGPSSDQLPRVPTGARLVTFVITPPSEPASANHELEIVSESGTARWRGSGLRPNAERTFTVTVPRALLPSGLSRLRLYESRAAGPRLIAEYAVRVEP